MPASNQSKFTTLAEWAAAREDMRIVCACGRTINLTAGKIIIETAKLNRVDPHAWLADTLTRLANGHRINALGDLMPWTHAAREVS